MDEKTASAKRKSTRAFLDKNASINIINKIIEQAKTAPSDVNTRPWQVAVVTGDSKDNICRKLEKACRYMNNLHC
ncbi:MAG: nitroreductase family protein [Gammaproteobacteria bacterium]|jgi:nitroreductase